VFEGRLPHVLGHFVAGRRSRGLPNLSALFTIILSLTYAWPKEANAQGWDFGSLESAYDDFADYLSEMGEFSGKDWTVRVGAGGGFVPDYNGSDQYEFKGLPIFQVRYKDDIWIDPLGARVKVWSMDCCRLLAQANIASGRSPDKDSRIALLPDFSTGAEVGFTFEGQLARFFAFRLRARQEVAGGHSGTSFAAAIGSIIRTGKFEFIPEIGTEWRSNDYMDAYYGVPASVTATTGYTAYDPGSGLEDVTFRLTSRYELDEYWQVIMRTEAGFLLSEAKNTPFIQQDGDSFQGLFGVGVLYTF